MAAVFLSDIYKDDPSITWNVLISSLHKGSGFIDGVVLSRQIKSHNVVIDPLLFDFRHIIDLLRRLDAVPYGFKIFYRCLRETQVICRGHQKLADDIEREAKRSECNKKALLGALQRACTTPSHIFGSGLFLSEVSLPSQVNVWSPVYHATGKADSYCQHAIEFCFTREIYYG